MTRARACVVGDSRPDVSILVVFMVDGSSPDVNIPQVCVVGGSSPDANVRILVGCV